MTRAKRGLIGLLAIAMAATGCDSGHKSSHLGSAAGPEPVLEVVTGLYPLAQAVNLIGNGKANAVDVVPPGSSPLSYDPSPSDSATMDSARLVVLATPGFQSTLDRNAPNVVYAGTGLGEPYFWLDPPAMRKAVAAVAAAMERADPPAAADFRNGATAFEDELESTGIDYQSTLSTCPRRTVFAADSAFSAVAKRYDLDYVALGTAAAPDPSVVSTQAGSVRSSGATTVFSEPWISSATVKAVAGSAGVKVRMLDTLLGPPPGGWPRQATYLNLLESNLGALSAALGCATSAGP